MVHAVKRYEIPGPEWCRTLWTARARELWESRFTAINKAWQATELASVGLFRSAARQSISPELLPTFTKRAVTKGLYPLVLAQHGMTSAYSSRSTAPVGSAFDYSVALCADADAAKMFAQAWEAKDDAIMGDLLGFPKCCIDFYQRVWNAEKWMDTTWPMALNTPDPVATTFDRGHILKFADTPVTANILLRWKGVRYVPHLPCSLTCEHTAAFGDKFRFMLQQAFPQEAAWMDELLESPIEWSAYHGIGEIRHPLFKVSIKTDPTAERIMVQRASKSYPERGERGTEFPYVRHVPKRAAVSELKLVKAPQPLSEALWKDNGFASYGEMQRVHAHIIDFASSVSQSTDRIVDLGCGNGLLVSQLTKFPIGVEQDVERVKRAVPNVMVLHAAIEDFISENHETFGAALLMPGRLLEMTPVKAQQTIKWLQTYARVAIVYAYGDWLTRHNGLIDLCEKTGVALSVASVKVTEGCSVGRLL